MKLLICDDVNQVYSYYLLVSGFTKGIATMGSFFIAKLR